MPAGEYSLEDAADHIAQVRAELSQKEEQQEIGTLTVDGTITATGGTAAVPTLISTDTWHDSGSLTNSWSKASGFLRYKLLPDGFVAVAAQGLTPGTVADGTTICSAANGLPAGYRPATNKPVVADTNYLKAAPVGSGGTENARLVFHGDGSIECCGFGSAATYCNCYGIFPTDI